MAAAGAGRPLRIALALLLLAATAAVYWPARRFDFSLYDDRPYVVWNERVRTGLSWENAGWAFTTFHQANWHPLTWLSHQLDAEIWGLDAGGHHVTSVLLHLANTAALFALLASATGAPWRSVLVAGLFALHPLHVESVAWVAERKDVLSTLLLLTAFAAYLRHARRPSRRRLATVAGLFALGLAAKPMLVTFPLLLLLFDWWPLGRVARPAPREPPAARRSSPAWRALVREKLPLFALAAASSAVTLVAQRSGGGLRTLEQIPAGQRLANAAVSYGAYLAKALWPSGLAGMYPYPAGGPAAARVAASIAVLGTVSWAALRWRRTRPAAAVGWLWYLAMLVPVIGIVQVGSQAMADRYTYVPLVGVFLALAWALGAAAAAAPRRALAAGLAAAAALAAFGAGARAQLWHWRDTGAVSAREHEVRGSAVDAAIEEAAMHEAHGDPARAEAGYRRALAIDPGNAKALNNLGVLVFSRGRREEGIALVREAIRARPEVAEAHHNLGSLLFQQGRVPEAADALREALRLRPGFPEAAEGLRAVQRAQGR